MKAHEHRAIGDEAAAGALVDLAGGRSDTPFLVRHGDVIALSGDFFPPTGLFEAAVPEEIRCALKVMAVDEATPDPRVDGVQFPQDVERRVRDRFLALAAANHDHFLAPWGEETAVGSARDAYRRLHQRALDEACRLGRTGGDLAGAMAREAAAQHYLTDAFASGHVRTPISAVRAFWLERYPQFWESLKYKIAADTAAALREIARPMRLLPSRVVYDRTLSAVQARTRDYPPVSLGDLLGRVFHDWDNDNGLVLEDGAMLYGDGHLEEGVGRRMAVAAVRAGIDDVEVAFGLGKSGSWLSGEPLYRTVREATGAGASAFRAESHLPRLSPDNPPLNWRARDVDELWSSPIAGSTGTTVGEAVTQVLEPGGEVSRRLDCLGQGVVEAFDVVNLPVVRGWLGRKACQAYHHGFIEALGRHPKESVDAVVARAGPAATSREDVPGVVPA